MNSLKYTISTKTVAFLVIILSSNLIQNVTNVPLGPFVKVCSSRELKQVTESICSTVVRRSGIPRLPRGSEPIKVANSDTLPVLGDDSNGRILKLVKRSAMSVKSQASERVRSKLN